VRVAAVVDRIPGTTGDAVLTDLGRSPLHRHGRTRRRERLRAVAGRRARHRRRRDRASRRPFAVDGKSRAAPKPTRAATRSVTARSRAGAAASAALALAALGSSSRSAPTFATTGASCRPRAQRHAARPASRRRREATLVAVVGAVVGALEVAPAFLVTNRVSHRPGGRTRPPLDDGRPLTSRSAPRHSRRRRPVVWTTRRAFADPRAGPDRRRGMSSLVDLRDVRRPPVRGRRVPRPRAHTGVEPGEICVVLGRERRGSRPSSESWRVLRRPSAGLALVDGLDVFASAPRSRGTARPGRRLRRPALLAGALERPHRRGARRPSLGLRGAPRPERDRRARSCSSASACSTAPRAPASCPAASSGASPSAGCRLADAARRRMTDRRALRATAAGVLRAARRVTRDEGARRSS
jgi:hypothetical protein